MNILSLFDGISCGYVALNKNKMNIKSYFSSEIDSNAIKISKQNHKNITYLGDINNWRNWNINWKNIDLIFAGFPCQDLSLSGKRLGFNGKRSSLFFIFLDILKHIKKYNKNVLFLVENVVSVKKNIDIINNKLELTPTILNSSLVSAQNRIRLYWHNWSLRYEIKDLNISFLDILEENIPFQIDDLNYLKEEHSDLISHIKNKQLILPNSPSFSTGAMRGRYINKEKNKTRQFLEFRKDLKINCITTVSKNNIIMPFKLNNKIEKELFPFRYLTQIENERGQCLPDNYTLGFSDAIRQKCIGNGWTIDIISFLLNNI